MGVPYHEHMLCWLFTSLLDVNREVSKKKASSCVLFLFSTDQVMRYCSTLLHSPVVLLHGIRGGNFYLAFGNVFFHDAYVLCTSIAN
jgi:hypothetical protein